MRSMVEGVLRLARTPLHRRTGGHAQVRSAPSTPPPFRGKGGLSIPRTGEDFIPPRLRLAPSKVLAEGFGQPAGAVLVCFAH